MQCEQHKRCPTLSGSTRRAAKAQGTEFTGANRANRDWRKEYLKERAWGKGLLGPAVGSVDSGYRPGLQSSSGGAFGSDAQCAASPSNSGSGVSQHCRHSSGVNGFRFFSTCSIESSSISLGSPSFMDWRIASAIERPVRLAACRTSPSRSAGIANGKVSLFMDESYKIAGRFQGLNRKSSKHQVPSFLHRQKHYGGQARPACAGPTAGREAPNTKHQSENNTRDAVRAT